MSAAGPARTHKIVAVAAEGTRLSPTGKAVARLRADPLVEHEALGLDAVPGHRARHDGVQPTPTPAPTSKKGEIALAYAKKQLGKPYKYGATGPKSFDCSGLTLRAWQSAGVNLPRTSQQQFKAGTKITKSQLRPGDLVFFYSSRPSHVGIYAGDGLIIHAPRPGKKVQYIKMSYMPYAGARRPG